MTIAQLDQALAHLAFCLTHRKSRQLSVPIIALVHLYVEADRTLSLEEVLSHLSLK